MNDAVSTAWLGKYKGPLLQLQVPGSCIAPTESDCCGCNDVEMSIFGFNGDGYMSLAATSSCGGYCCASAPIPCITSTTCHRHRHVVVMSALTFQNVFISDDAPGKNRFLLLFLPDRRIYESKDGSTRHECDDAMCICTHLAILFFVFLPLPPPPSLPPSSLHFIFFSVLTTMPINRRSQRRRKVRRQWIASGAWLGLGLVLLVSGVFVFYHAG